MSDIFTNEIIVYVSETTVKTLDGRPALLSCQANGLPLPQIRWTKNGQTIVPNAKFNQLKIGDLQIKPLTLDDQGIYVCEAFNFYGKIQTEVTVEVIKKSVPKDDQDLPREIVKNVHDNVTLNCGISFDPRVKGETKVKWFKKSANGQEPLDTDHDLKYSILANDSLSINSLGVTDKGVYVCTVDTPFESLDYSVELFVHGEPPKILSQFNKLTLYEGEPLVIPCRVRGVPLPSLKWFFNDKSFTGNVKIIPNESVEILESRIKIPKVTKIHQGVYQCEAANTYGSGVAKYAKVNVIHRTNVQVSRNQFHGIFSFCDLHEKKKGRNEEATR